MAANVNPVRNVSRNTLGLAVSAACAGVPATQAQAVIEEIIVTSTKREVNMQDVPIAITAFTNKDIVREGFKTFSDYAGRIPSLAISERQPGATSVIMRGCAAQGLSFSDSATTSVYLDEQPITASGYNPDPRLIDVQRVEALSGPQGTLFGDAAQCGTLRIITNKPDTTELGGWVDATGMTVDGGDTGYDVSGMFNLPIIEDKLALRLVGFVAEEPGFVDNVLSPSPGSDPSLGVDPAENFDNSEFVDDDINTGTYYGGRAGLRWNVTEDWTMDFNGIYQKYELKDGFGDVDLNQQLYSDTATFPTLGEMDQVRFGNEDWEDKWYQLSITSEANLGFANLVVTGAYYDRKSEYNADGTAYLQAFQQFGDTYFPYYNIYDFNGDPQATDFDKRESQTWSVEARLASAESDSRWGWIGGFFYNHREVDELFTSNVRNLWDSATGETPAGYYLNYSYYNLNAGSSARSNNWFTGTYDSDLDQWAVFGEASFDLTENFVITAGGRYYDIENDYTVVQAALVGLNGGGIDCSTVYCYTGMDDTGSGNDDGFVPKVNIAWTVSDQLLYATYSEGFRRGGVNSARPQSIYGAPGQFPPPAGTRNEYGSDTVKNVEAGFKTDWFDDSLRFNLTGYWMKWDDIQVQAEDTETGTFSLGIVNLPEAEIKGFDAWLDWAATESLSLGANIGYNHAEVSETFALTPPGIPPGPDDTVITDGTQLPLMPDWKINLNGTYTFQQELLSATPYVLANYVYWGESVNSLGIESSNFTFPVREQPSWQTVDLRAGLDSDTWSASIYVENVFDEYAELFYNNRFAQQRLSVNQPRTYGIGFRKYFGMQNIAR